LKSILDGEAGRGEKAKMQKERKM